MANTNINTEVVETTDNTEQKVGFVKKHGKKIAIGLGALAAAGIGYLIGNIVGSKKNTTNEGDSEDYNTGCDDETIG